MIDLRQELSAALPEAAMRSGAADHARVIARRRRTRRRAGLVALAAAVVLVLLGVGWAVAVRQPARSTIGVTVGPGEEPGPGADAPMSVTVTCTADGPVASSDTVQVGSAGVTIDWRNETDLALTGALSGRSDFGNGIDRIPIDPHQTRTMVSPTSPGDALLACQHDDLALGVAVGLTLVDPTRIFHTSELDCASVGDEVFVNLGGGPPARSVEESLADLAPDVMADHDLEPAGYPGAVDRTYIVRHAGRTVALADIVRGPGTFLLRGLFACRDVLASP